MSPASGGGPAGSRDLPGKGLALAAALAAGAFVAAAAVRRLNFDEPLALRAGYLALAGVPAEPGFAMPFTVLVGALGRALEDPGHVFLAARLLVVLSVLGALAAAFRAADPARGAVPGALLFTLANGAFFVHGLEFRYDAAILVLLVAALPLLVHGSDEAFVALGLVAGLLAAHHLKGLWFAAAVAFLAALRGGLRAVPRVAGGAAAALAAWLLVASATGTLAGVAGLYSSFLGVAAESERRWPWAALGEAFRRDASWWGLALAAGLWSAGRLAGRSRAEARRSPETWALALLGAALGFLLVHPRPFPYMLALPAPFAGFVAAGAAAAAGPRLRAAAAGAAALLLAAQALGPAAPFSGHAASFRAPIVPQVEALRWLKARAEPGERVLDPSGLAYFLPPCTRQWYLDSMFEKKARAGAWMGELPRTDLAGCPWMVLTYRLRMLPPPFLPRLPAEYRPAREGVALHVSSRRWTSPGMERNVAPVGLESFW